MSNKVRVEAKDVATAIAQGLKDLGLRREQAEVTVIESPKKGFLGFGSKPAIVEVRQKRWTSSNLDAQIYMDVPKKKKPTVSRGGRGAKAPRRESAVEEVREERSGDKRRGGGRKPFARSGNSNRRPSEELRDKTPKANEPQQLPSLEIQNAVVPEHMQQPMQEAKQYLEQVLNHMGVKVENLHVWWDDKQQRILLTFDCDHPAIVIGKEGKTLEAIQYLSTLALSRHFDKPISVITDTQNYWRKAEDKINAEIEKGLSLIKEGHGVFRFRPMSAQLRRYIHRALEGSELVSTSSEGEGKWRKVTLRSKGNHVICDDTNAETFTSCECEDALDAEPICEAAASVAVVGGTESVLEQVKELAEQVHQAAAALEANEQLAEQIEQTVAAQAEVLEEGGCSGSCASRSCCGHDTPAPVVEVIAEPIITPAMSDEVHGATCQAEIARNCGEGEAQVGCACEAEHETPKQGEEQPVVTAPEPEAVKAEETAQSEAIGGTCQAEIARNCPEEESHSGCACGPLFEAPKEAENPETK